MYKTTYTLMLNPGTGRVQNFGQSSVRRPRHLHTLRTNHIAPLCCTQTVGVEGHREVHAAPPGVCPSSNTGEANLLKYNDIHS